MLNPSKFEPSKRGRASRLLSRKRNVPSTTSTGDEPIQPSLRHSADEVHYPTFPDVDPSVLQGLTPVSLVGRSKQLPQLYTFEGPHPSHRAKTSQGRTFVYLLDSSPEGKALSLALSESMGVPGGPVSGA